ANLMKLLAREGMVSTLAAAVNMVADGDTPVALLEFIALPGRYTVDEEGGTTHAKAGAKKKKSRAPPPDVQEPRAFVSEKSYARYDAATALFTAMEPSAAARKYSRVRPYFET